MQTNNDKLQIRSGEKVYFDSFGGMIKGIYLGMENNLSLYNHRMYPKCKIKITSTNNKTYKYGEIIFIFSHHIFPRRCYHKTGIFTYSVYPDYVFI
jgi:hypothetical protein